MSRVLDEIENPMGYAVDFRMWLTFMRVQGVICQNLFNVCWQSHLRAKFLHSLLI